MAQINLIKKDTILPILHYIDWDVVIDGVPHFVVKVEGYVHTIGGRYGENDLWAYPRDKAPNYETLIEFNSEKPVAWGIQYEPKNYTKTKWDEISAYNNGGITITRNGEVFCHVAGGLYYGIDKARVMIAQFEDHPLELNSILFRPKAIGRKVWWRSEPAVIARYVDRQACVILEPDGIEKDATATVFVEIIAVPMFFTKESWID